MPDVRPPRGNLRVVPFQAPDAEPETGLRLRGSRLHFDRFELDCSTATLRRDGSDVPLTSLSFQLLEYLVRQRDRVVTSEELLEAVWADVTVTSGSVRQAIFELRKGLDDCAAEPRIIRTVRGRGYQFVALVSEAPMGLAEGPPMVHASESFFGRAHELQRLTLALVEAGERSGRCCVLSGPAGIGKSRLACELANRAKARGIAVLEGWSEPDGRMPPLWPWLQMLRGHLRALTTDQAAALHAAHPVIRRLLVESPGDAPAARVEADAAKQLRTDLLRELGDAFVAIARAQPLLLLFEDAQWADEASLALLGHMASLQSQTRALLLVTHRDVPMREHRTLGRAIASLKRGALNELFKLERLGTEEVKQLLAAHLEEVVPAIAAEVYDVSRGNPLFALELARLLARSGARVSLRDECARELRSVMLSRLSFLSDDAAEAARAAAVLGIDFSLGHLAGVLACESAEALARVDACMELEVVEETAHPTRFRFAHPLLRDALYESLSRGERAELHRRAGMWLEQLEAGADDQRLSEMAHHFHVAAPSEPRKAIVYLLRSAERAFRATAYQEALRQYERALAVAELDLRSSVTEKLDIALLQGDAMRAAGVDAEQVDRHFLKLAERAEALGDARMFARAVLGYTGQRGERFTPTQFDARVNAQDIALLERAQQGLGAGSDDLRVLLMGALSFALVCSTDCARREQVAHEALTLARALGQPQLLARTLLIAVRCSPTCWLPEQKIEACSELVDVTYAHGLREQELEARSLRAVAQLSRGDLAAARADEQRMVLLAESLGTPRARARAQLLELMRAFWCGRLEETEVLAQRMLDAAPLELAEQALWTVRMAAVRSVREGLSPTAVALYEQLHARYPEGVGFRCALASIRATMGDMQAARAHLEWAAEDDFARIPVDGNWLSAMFLLADAAKNLGDSRYAAQLYQRLLPYSDVFDFCVGEACPQGCAALWLAELCTTMRRFDEARHWVDRAQGLFARLGATLFLHYLTLTEARLWMDSHPHERAHCRPVLLELRARMAEMNAGWLVTCADHALSQIDTDPALPVVAAPLALASQRADLQSR